MSRDTYTIFSPGRIGTLSLPNRLVRSATWDPSILRARRLTGHVLDLYRELAAGGVGMIITGDFSVVPAGLLEGGAPDRRGFSYGDVSIDGFGDLPGAVHDVSADCRIVAQVSGDAPGVAPSARPSAFSTEIPRPLGAAEIGAIVDCFVEVIAGLRDEGFDGVQFHAAHGGLLSRFLSPYSNRRQDEYGGSVRNRTRMVSEIVGKARERVGDYPLLIKVNGTDYLPGGIDLDSFPELAAEIERAGLDALEVSGGMWDCLLRSEAELGFRPVPSPESHIRIGGPARQSYFLPYAERVDLSIPVILVGGNRNVERLEEILNRGQVEFVALCRPLICEPDLPRRWLEGRGSSGTDCISCNGCLYDMWTSVDRGQPWVANCLFKQDRARLRAAQHWLSTWVQENALDGAPHSVL
jgi:2,4-dienoyl-CoA reductase-like NADH-dependent reductase (Old Yellow Enzyme family)